MLELAVNILKFSAPVGIAAVGESAVQRTGVLNIGIEGMMLSAAFFAVLVSMKTGSPWLGLLAGILSALVLCLIQAFFTQKLLVDQVVVGTGINLLALGVTSTLFRAVFGQSGQLVSAPKIPAVIAGLDPVLLALPFLAVAVAWLLFRSKWGLAARGAGEYPDAVEAAGFSVLRLRLQAQLIGAVLAGLAGAYLSLGIAGSFAENMTLGRGFIAIAMVTFGRFGPWGALGASLLVGVAEQMQFQLQSQNWGVPFQLFQMLPYLAALLVLVAVGKGTVTPLALGRPYRRAK